MPTLISETDVKLERNDLLRRVVLPRAVSSDGFIVPPTRTPGLHLSGLLRYVAQKSKITAYINDVAEEDLPIRWMLGQVFEEFAVSLFPDMVWQPYECQSPLIMNCDGISVSHDEGPFAFNGILIREFKFNRAKKYSGADLLRKKTVWMWQGMGYCLGYGATRVQWEVMSVMEWPDPLWTQYLVEFSDKELRGMERMIESNRAGAIAEGYCE
jgi:hypothetical protein